MGDFWESEEETQAERNLFWAVIERAIFDATGHWHLGGSDGPKEGREARSWIDARGSEHDEFTFEWYCLQLGVDTGSIRSFVINYDGRLKLRICTKRGHLISEMIETSIDYGLTGTIKGDIFSPPSCQDTELKTRKFG